MTKITIYSKTQLTENLIATGSTDAITSLEGFSTGKAAFNWARKVGANNVTVIVKSNRRGHNSEPMTMVRDHDDLYCGLSSSDWDRVSL